ncbi:general stress protein B [Lentilactobacillus laojiaonis]|uniref:general stress protein B n=1 Tax=Lentilactobacillus laojiaonis TaxID=2883998 RepID=UPI001D0B2682|nr:general stress protein B [Lentilactobacillus laojiaonis]UDM32694.1 general stress protein B [Lentilactobacillus laojiaonis]UDM32710.1 general stress protein B [Lentilactobacillus laojiaonis]
MAKESKATRQYNGSLGGKKTVATHGHEFYKEIGAKGGRQTAATHSKAFYHDIAEKGNAAKKARK